MKTNKIILVLVVLLLYSIITATAFAASDNILSGNIKEADGTTGQNTNSGSGIKTEHIQNSAITPSKIGFYKNVVIVSPSGGNFTNPVDALNSITDSSATNPYLVKIMPGVYDIGAGSVYMKPFVDIEGSGEDITKITGDTASFRSRGCKWGRKR